MKVLIDINVIVDVVQDRKKFINESSKILGLVNAKIIDGYMSSFTPTVVNHIRRKKIITSKENYIVSNKLRNIFKMAVVNNKTHDIAEYLDFKDFEDSIMAALAIQIGAKYIITRNLKDFKTSRVQAVSPKEFLEIVNAKDITYKWNGFKNNMENINYKDIKSIIQSLKEGIKEFRNSDKYKEILNTMAKFYNYSYGNVLLIYMQNPEATYCGSIKLWNSLGRYISKGEKGIKIICPNPKIQQVELKDENGNVLLDENGKPQVEEITKLSFSIGNTFDISQTYGKELAIERKELVGDGLDIPDFINVMKEIAGVNDIRLEDIKDGAKGYFHIHNNEIVIKKEMSDLQTTKTVLHETAHAVVFSDKELAKTINMGEHEVIAESVAYIVCKRFGLDTSEYSFDYVNSWANADDNVIEKCIECISKTSQNIINKMESKLGLKCEISTQKEKYISDKKDKKKIYSAVKSKQQEMK